MLQMKYIRVKNILVNLNLTVEKNKFVLVVGENGAGKTTLFNVISGVISPESGSIYIDGRDVTSIPACARAALVSNVFQDPKVGTIGNMTIRENLRMAYLRGKSRRLILGNSRSRDDFYREKLRILNMNFENRLNDYVGVLSGGQRQALSIAMSMMADSKLLLLDEITAALDPKSSENILNIIQKIIRQEKKTCLMITHNVEHFNQLGDGLLRLQNGACHALYG
ncbi:MAG: ATP-binding cassette domain-containing protein [Holosporaceae bacterium]|jgi:putative ABC transport system ATP-binding protein|nr:ATP-binding cassette domain-containing protein [Holosporaceae bacterium]